MVLFILLLMLIAYGIVYARAVYGIVFTVTLSSDCVLRLSLTDIVQYKARMDIDPYVPCTVGKLCFPQIKYKNFKDKNYLIKQQCYSNKVRRCDNQKYKIKNSRNRKLCENPVLSLFAASMFGQCSIFLNFILKDSKIIN